jgi:hypothetical protein
MSQIGRQWWIKTSFFGNINACPSADTNCNKLFSADPYGSNYLILGQIGKLFERVMLYALPVVGNIKDNVMLWIDTGNKKEAHLPLRQVS